MSDNYVPVNKLMSKAQLNSLLCAMDSNKLGRKFPLATPGIVREILVSYQAFRGMILRADELLCESFDVAETCETDVLASELDMLRTILVALPIADFHAFLDSYSFRSESAENKDKMAKVKERSTLSIPSFLTELEKRKVLPPATAEYFIPRSNHDVVKEEFVPRTHFHMKSNDWLIAHGCSVQIKDGFRKIVTEENLMIRHEYDPNVNQEKK